MNIRILSLAALSAAALVPSAHGATRPETTEPSVFVPIKVTITDSRIVVSPNSADRGDGVNFLVRNTGRRVHNFVFRGSGALALSSDGLATPLLKPDQSAILQVYMDVRGTYVYLSTAKRDLAKPGMRGTFKIT